MVYVVLLFTEQTKNLHFEIYWDSGKNNLAHYYTNHHTAQYHKYIKYIYARDKLNCMPSQYVKCMPPRMMQGCVGTRPYSQRMMTQAQQDADDVDKWKNNVHPTSRQYSDDVAKTDTV